MPKIPDEIKLNWVDLFLKGNTITDISRITGSSRKNIMEELLIRGLRDKDKTPLQRKLTNKTPEKIMSLVNEGKTDKEIMVELGISRTMIWRYRQKIGFKKNTNQTKTLEHHINNVWNYLFTHGPKTKKEIMESCKISFYVLKDLVLLDIVVPLSAKDNHRLQSKRFPTKRVPIFYRENRELNGVIYV